MFASDKTWYSVELSRPHAHSLKDYLRKARIYFEPSEAGNLIHFECHMTAEECEFVNDFLSKIAKGAVNNEQPTA